MAFEDAQNFLANAKNRDSAPEGFETVSEPKQKPAAITANYEQTDEGTYKGSLTTDPSQYSTFTAAPGEEGVKNPFNRKVHLRCEFGNPNGAHSESGKATHFIYLNGGPTMDPLEVPMAACAHHEVKVRERAAQLNPEVQPYFKPITNRRQIAEHRAKLDAMNKSKTLTMEAGLRNAGVQEGTPEALWGRTTPSFYVRGKVASSESPELEALKERRGETKLYRIRGGKHSGKLLFLNPQDVEEGTALQSILDKSFSAEGAGRSDAPEGFEKQRVNRPPGYYFPPKYKKLSGTDSGVLPIEQRGVKQKVAHVMGLHRSGIPHAMAMLEAHRLGVHSEVESLMKTHMGDFTTETDEEGNVTIRPGRRPQRSAGTVGVGTRGEVAAGLPAERTELDLTTGEVRPLTPIEAFTEEVAPKTEQEFDVAARQAATAERLRAIEARKQRLVNRRKRPALPGNTLKNELDKGTGNS